MGDRTRLTTQRVTRLIQHRHPRAVFGALGVLATTGALLVVGPASASHAAGTPATVAPVLAPVVAPVGLVIDPAVAPAAPAQPLFDPAGLARIAAYVTSVIPAPAPPPAPVVTPPPAAPVKKVTAPKTTAPKTTAPKTTASKAATPAAPVASAGSAYEQRLLVLVNQARAQAGIGPVAYSSCAAGFATSWSAQQASVDAMSHQSLSPIMSKCHARGAGENVAYGNISADQMFTNWMNSAGHRANILNPAFNAMGNGASVTASGRVYGTQDFLTL